MARDAWFQRTTWSEVERADFYARLERSRSSSTKAQYLLTQAAYLAAAGDQARLSAAIELIDDMLARCPYDFHLALAHQQRAECLDALDRTSEAIESFRAGVTAQRAFPNVRTRVALVFGMFCIRRDLVALFEEAEAYVAELSDASPFPRDTFEANAVFALARAHRGDATAAREAAAGALDAAARTASVPGHPTLGLVNDIEPRLLTKLLSLKDPENSA